MQPQRSQFSVLSSQFSVLYALFGAQVCTRQRLRQRPRQRPREAYCRSEAISASFRAISALAVLNRQEIFFSRITFCFVTASLCNATYQNFAQHINAVVRTARTSASSTWHR